MSFITKKKSVLIDQHYCKCDICGVEEECPSNIKSAKPPGWWVCTNRLTEGWQGEQITMCNLCMLKAKSDD